LRRQKDADAFFPGLPKRNPGLKLANAFSVIVALQELSVGFSFPIFDRPQHIV